MTQEAVNGSMPGARRPPSSTTCRDGSMRFIPGADKWSIPQMMSELRSLFLGASLSGLGQEFLMRFDLGHQRDQLGPVEFPGERLGAAVGQLLVQGQSQPQRFQVREV